jgi:hypothetical protein
MRNKPKQVRAGRSVTIWLKDDEYAALAALSAAEYRRPGAKVRMIVGRWLKARKEKRV